MRKIFIILGSACLWSALTTSGQAVEVAHYAFESTLSDSATADGAQDLTLFGDAVLTSPGIVGDGKLSFDGSGDYATAEKLYTLVLHDLRQKNADPEMQLICYNRITKCQDRSRLRLRRLHPHQRRHQIRPASFPLFLGSALRCHRGVRQERMQLGHNRRALANRAADPLN